MILDRNNQFVTLEGKATGVFASRTKSGRWQYKGTSGAVMASGMRPAAFVKSFWLRDDFVETGA